MSNTGGDWQDDPRYLPSLQSPLDLVEPGLYLGSVMGRDKVLEKKIDVVVSLLTEETHRVAEPLPARVREVSICLDDTDKVDLIYLNKALDQATAAIREARAAGKTVFVHCGAGISRSATVVLDYWMAREPTLSLEQALERLTEKRYCVCPNPLFQRVLRERAQQRV